jgi:hypothetical protein
MKTSGQKLEEMLKKIEAMPLVEIPVIAPEGVVQNDINEENNDIRGILMEKTDTKKKKKSGEDEEENTPQSFSDLDSLQPQNPLTLEPKSLKTGFMRRRTDIKIPEPVKSVSGGTNRMPMASSQMDQILAGMMAQPSIIARQRSNLTNSYSPFQNDKSVLSENLKAKVVEVLNKPKYQKEINRMKKEISGNNENSR